MALGSASIALVTPKILPVITLMSANASTAANAPPARSFAQLPPMATANRMCRLLITAQPMFSMVVPMVMTAAMSAPHICTSLPKLIIRPAAGITAITVMSTLPSFCRKSKLMNPFFLVFFALVSSPAGAAFDSSTACSFSVRVIICVLPAFAVPFAQCSCIPSAPPVKTMEVMVFRPRLRIKSRFTFATG